MPATVICDGYEVTINGTLDGQKWEPGEIVTGKNEKYTKNGTAVIPVGFAIVPELDDVSEGLVISDVANDTEVEDYNKMKKSVEENKGFYIGRYETGIDENNKAVVKKDKPVYNNIKWGNSMTDSAGGAAYAPDTSIGFRIAFYV